MTTHGMVWGALLVVAMASGGCTAARMAVPSELKGQAPALPVERHMGLTGGGSLRFGPHQVTDFQQGWTSAPGVKVSGVNLRAESTPYRFRSTPEGEKTRAVECQVTRERIEAGGLEADVQPRRVNCVIAADGPEFPAGQFRLDHEPGRDLSNPHGRVTGRARLGEVALEIESSTRLEGGASLAFAGFHLRQGERLVAAVETLNEGRVWLAPDLTPEVRVLTVMVSSALLLDSGWQSPTE
ncbi:hypothetical protein [Hyalangium rubrum]|uniref:Lipoprotein n=1 Tax=Hyalangium rubrum TaxID=3103134 RepID=A0ABU5H859_9BACT|nr:hypothetical protein [Hyalangium sp. s54d21]MDY7229327.1 hypothetical protein [Hyalangium sp. s54d21]